MPAEDYAEYLTNTLHFTLSPLYYLFNKDAFLTTLHQFYQNQHSTSSLWQIKMLLVFAFGTSILARGAGKSGPAGSAYLARAVEALPDPHRLRQDPILSIEVLCLLALFMQAMDMRRAAYDYVCDEGPCSVRIWKLINSLDWTGPSHLFDPGAQPTIRRPEDH